MDYNLTIYCVSGIWVTYWCVHNDQEPITFLLGRWDARQPHCIPHTILKSPPELRAQDLHTFISGALDEGGLPMPLKIWWWKWTFPAEKALTHNPCSKMQFQKPSHGAQPKNPCHFICEDNPSMSLSCHRQRPWTPVDLATEVFSFGEYFWNEGRKK